MKHRKCPECGWFMVVKMYPSHMVAICNKNGCGYISEELAIDSGFQDHLVNRCLGQRFSYEKLEIKIIKMKAIICSLCKGIKDGVTVQGLENGSIRDNAVAYAIRSLAKKSDDSKKLDFLWDLMTEVCAEKEKSDE